MSAPAADVAGPATFAFSDENLVRAKTIIAKYPEGRQASAVIPLLDIAQRQCGNWLPRAAMAVYLLALVRYSISATAMGKIWPRSRTSTRSKGASVRVASACSAPVAPVSALVLSTRSTAALVLLTIVAGVSAC